MSHTAIYVQRGPCGASVIASLRCRSSAHRMRYTLDCSENCPRMIYRSLTGSFHFRWLRCLGWGPTVFIKSQNQRRELLLTQRIAIISIVEPKWFAPLARRAATPTSSLPESSNRLCCIVREEQSRPEAVRRRQQANHKDKLGQITIPSLPSTIAS